MAAPTGLRPLLAEGLWRGEAAALGVSPVWRGAGVPPGRGLGVLLIPGLMAGDAAVASMENWLGRCGYRPARSGFALNVDCPRKAHRALERRLQALVASTGRRAVVVGHSRGGLMGKLLAALRPELVAGIVTLGTPHVRPFAVHPAVKRQVDSLAALGSLGIPGMIGAACLPGGSCWKQVEDDLGRPLASHVAFTSVFSRSDGVVDWRSCLDPGAECVEVASTHVGMPLHPTVYTVLASRLGALAGRHPTPNRGTACGP
jgi:pimeloyl-ACP methyl ester carboxylesterase